MSEGVAGAAIAEADAAGASCCELDSHAELPSLNLPLRRLSSIVDAKSPPMLGVCSSSSFSCTPPVATISLGVTSPELCELPGGGARFFRRRWPSLCMVPSYDSSSPSCTGPALLCAGAWTAASAAAIAAMAAALASALVANAIWASYGAGIGLADAGATAGGVRMICFGTDKSSPNPVLVWSSPAVLGFSKPSSSEMVGMVDLREMIALAIFLRVSSGRYKKTMFGLECDNLTRK
mmetsp:Transcript_9639/g.22934  ORF Transcript_9639/g.22934 Transcript_9639/m.22934 type:complete len:236 (-) Transcript_9639:2180-2887(-)